MFKFASSANAECASNTKKTAEKKTVNKKREEKKEETLAAGCK